MVWMVLGGPAVVVVASLFTYYLAARAPDPVLTPQAPAVTGRNHAATGEVPAKATAPMASAP